MEAQQKKKRGLSHCIGRVGGLAQLVLRSGSGAGWRPEMLANLMSPSEAGHVARTSVGVTVIYRPPVAPAMTQSQPSEGQVCPGIETAHRCQHDSVSHFHVWGGFSARLSKGHPLLPFMIKMQTGHALV